MKAISYAKEMIHRIRRIEKKIDTLQLAAARMEGRQVEKSADRYEYQIYSQFGEDGIIQHLVKNLDIKDKRFIEFGVEDYTEANTRYLLINDNWSGLVIDGDEDNINSIKKESIYWKYNLKAIKAFITAENINELIMHNFGAGGGILSIDIDGNDYWVWKAINCIDPDIVIIEYNHRFGKQKSVTIPYDPNFYRADAHYSMIYFGASLAALVKLGNEKGYSLVDGNSNGNNAFFVRNDLLNEVITRKDINDVFRHSKVREARDRNGNLCFLTLEQEQKILSRLPLVEV